MADLNTLEGISNARNELYNQLEKAQISESRAAQMERVLRGQESLKAHVPIRLLNVVANMKGTRAEQYVAPLVKSLLVFVNGPAALQDLRDVADSGAGK